jgi:glutamate racemase
LGDNARAPYGTRSFETVYNYTLEAVKWFFNNNCHLVILACNTASAKALRTIQQNNLPKLAPNKRVLGVIRPITERANEFTQNGHLGILGTSGTIASNSYPIEINKFFPHIKVNQHACPMWVPIIENGEYNSEGADYFVQKDLTSLIKTDPKIDGIILGCTHYPLLQAKIQKYLPGNIKIISQGEIVAQSFKNYLKNHPEIEKYCTKNAECKFFTTENPDTFNPSASLFFGQTVNAEKTTL